MMIIVRLLTLCAVLFCSGTLMVWGTDREAPENLRCKYYYVFHKDTAAGAGVYVDSTMCLDVLLRDNETMFYSERAYLYDSTLVAMADAGMSYHDMMAAGVDEQYRGTKEMARYFIDLKNGEYVKYDEMYMMRFRGNGNLLRPEWIPGSAVDTVCGYPCQTAVVDYLGRRWSVWYTMELPVPAGPWLLWGFPGLVLQAVDQDRFFIFRAKEVGYASYDRSTALEELAGRNGKLRSYPISKMEQVLNKVKRSFEAADRMQGGSGFAVEINDDGTMEKFVPELKYLPLIPDEYWEQRGK